MYGRDRGAARSREQRACERDQKSGQVLGGLTHLPVGVPERGIERSVDRGPGERGKREDGSASDRRAVGAAGEDRIEAGRITHRAQRGDRRLAHERIRVGQIQ